MKKAMVIVVAALAVLSGQAEEEKKGYTCSMHVGNPTSQQTTSNGGEKSARSGSTSKTTKTKTVTRIVSWPVSGSIRGETPPPADAVKLKCYYFGTTDGKLEIMEEKDMDVALDEKGNFKTEATAPEEKIVHITTTTKSEGGRDRWGRRRGGGSASTKSTTSGTRVAGCIIQLMVKGKVERYYASNTQWSRFAKSDPLPTDEILKIR